MKQLLFLLLFPCLAMAQYTGNAGQKITLGEQTTADGLVYRGLAADTTRKPSVDTMAYILLDTNTNIIWQYKKATNNAWTKINLTQSDTTSFNYVNTYGTQTVNGAKTFGSAVTATRFNPTANTATGTGMFAPTSTSLGFSTDGTGRIFILSNGLVGIGVSNPSAALQVNGEIRVYPTSGTANLRFGINNVEKGKLAYDVDNNFIFETGGTEGLRINNAQEVIIGYGATDNGAYKLQVKDSVYVGGNVSASAYTTRSDYDLKDEIQNISYGLNEVMQMQPVKYTYKSNGSTQLGFIAQDLGVITPEVVSFEDKMSVYYNALIPILTKAIQEQNLLIKALEQRILILENK